MTDVHRLILPRLHETQQQVHDDPSRFRVVVCGRRWGKTRLGVSEGIEKAADGQQGWWVAPTYIMAQAGWHPLVHAVARVPGIEVRVSERTVRFPGGGLLSVRSADTPQRLRAAGLDFLIVDEAAYTKPEVWTEALRPTLVDRQGTAMFITTPRGKSNWLYDLWDQAARLPGWSQHRYPTSTNPYIPPAELDQARREMGDLLYRQEHEAEFLDAGLDTPFRSNWFRYFTVWDDDDGTVFYRVGDGLIRRDRCIHFGTVDPAVSTRTAADYSAVACCALTPEGQVLVLEVWRDRVEAPDLIPQLQRLEKKWRLGWIGVERTAYQLSVVQYARRAGLPVREITPEKDKVSRALGLAARMEGGDVWLLAEAPWLSVFEAECVGFRLDDTHAHDDQIDVVAYAAQQQQVMLTGSLGV